MSEPVRHQALIDALGAELTPVRRLLPPWQRALGWLAVVAAIALGRTPCCTVGLSRRTSVGQHAVV